jgi:hypothetical protein
MVIRYALRRSSIAEHRLRLVRDSSHPSLRSYFTESNVMTCPISILKIIREKKILDEKQIANLLDPVKLSNLHRIKYENK